MHRNKRARGFESAVRSSGRQFREKWLQDYLWLSVNEEQTVMWCDVCRNNDTVADINSAFVKGTSNFNHPSFEKHEKSEPHRRCLVLLPSHPSYEKTEVLKSLLNTSSTGRSVGNSSTSASNTANAKPEKNNIQSKPIETTDNSENLSPRLMQVQWKEHNSCINEMFSRLLANEHFVDVTLTCEGRSIRCHKIVLSACSPYFEQLLVENPCPHPIIFLKDMKYWEVEALIDFMYMGKVSITENCLHSFIKAAQSLSIRGLALHNFEEEDNMKNVISYGTIKRDYVTPSYSLQRKRLRHKSKQEFSDISLTPPPSMLLAPGIPTKTKPLSAVFHRNQKCDELINETTVTENCEVMVVKLEPTDIEPSINDQEKEYVEMEVAWTGESFLTSGMESEADQDDSQKGKSEKCNPSSLQSSGSQNKNGA